MIDYNVLKGWKRQSMLFSFDNYQIWRDVKIKYNKIKYPNTEMLYNWLTVGGSIYHQQNGSCRLQVLFGIKKIPEPVNTFKHQAIQRTQILCIACWVNFQFQMIILILILKIKLPHWKKHILTQTDLIEHPPNSTYGTDMNSKLYFERLGIPGRQVLGNSKSFWGAEKTWIECQWVSLKTKCFWNVSWSDVCIL